MKKAKIVLQLIESGGPGGAETVLRQLCTGLSDNEFYPIAVLFEKGWLYEQLVSLGIETFLIKTRCRYDGKLLFDLLKLIKLCKADILHSHEFTMNVYSTIAGLIARKPVVASVHGRNYYSDNLRRRLAYRFVSRCATKVVAVSGSLKEFLINELDLHPKKLVVIYNGVDTKAFNHVWNAKSDSLPANMPPGSPVIGTIGNLYPVKGHVYLIRAARKVIKIFPNAQFVIIGKTTPYLRELQSEAKKCGVMLNTTFLGFQEDIPDLLDSLDIFVLPSLNETFSIATIEAMAAGKPVVATKSGGPQEIIKHGDTGILVPPEDDEALSRSIIDLLLNKQLAGEMADRGRQHVQKHFTLEKMVENYRDLYLEVLKITS